MDMLLVGREIHVKIPKKRRDEVIKFKYIFHIFMHIHEPIKVFSAIQERCVLQQISSFGHSSLIILLVLVFVKKFVVRRSHYCVAQECGRRNGKFFNYQIE